MKRQERKKEVEDGIRQIQSKPTHSFMHARNIFRYVPSKAQHLSAFDCTFYPSLSLLLSTILALPFLLSTPLSLCPRCLFTSKLSYFCREPTFPHLPHLSLDDDDDNLFLSPSLSQQSITLRMRLEYLRNLYRGTWTLRVQSFTIQHLRNTVYKPVAKPIHASSYPNG